MNRFIGFLNLILWLIFPNLAFAKDFHICHFSMNNPKEFQATQDFLNRLSDSLKKQGTRITVSEHMTEGSDISKSFVDLVKSGTRCDGLILSGHHTSAFYGARGTGKLGIDFLEKLSCSKNDNNWFLQVKVLWLQGCRTLGVEKKGQAANADAHTSRVSQLLNEDDLTADPMTLNREFSTMMDEDNPIASRYRRIFPMATVLGWTDSGPGVKARSENSLSFHVAAMHAIDSQSAAITDPRKNMTKTTADGFASSLVNMFEQRDENQTLQAWKWSGQDAKVGFGQKDISGYISMRSVYNLAFEEAKKYDCLLKCGTLQNLEQTLTALLENENLLGYTLSSLLDTYHELKENKFLAHQQISQRIQNKLRNSLNFKNLLENKILSPRIGLLRKMDYAGDYVYLYGALPQQLRLATLEEFKKQLLIELKPDASQVEVLLFDAYKTSLIYRMSQTFPQANVEAFAQLYSKLPQMVFNYLCSEEVWSHLTDAQKTDVLFFALNKWPQATYSIMSRIRHNIALLNHIREPLLAWVYSRPENQTYVLETLLTTQLSRNDRNYVLSRLNKNNATSMKAPTRAKTFEERFLSNQIETTDLQQIPSNISLERLTKLSFHYQLANPQFGFPQSLVSRLQNNSYFWVSTWINTLISSRRLSQNMRVDLLPLTSSKTMLLQLIFDTDLTQILISNNDLSRFILKSNHIPQALKLEIFKIAVRINPVIATHFMDKFNTQVQLSTTQKEQLGQWSSILKLCLDTRLLSAKDERFVRHILAPNVSL